VPGRTAFVKLFKKRKFRPTYICFLTIYSVLTGLRREIKKTWYLVITSFVRNLLVWMKKVLDQIS